MDVMKKMSFCAFVGHERYKLSLGIFIVIVGAPPSSCVIISFLLTNLRKDFLTSTTLALPIFNGENCSVVGSRYSVTSF